MTVLVIIVGGVALGLTVAQDQQVLRVKVPLNASEATFPDYAAALVGAGVTSGDGYRLLQNGDEIFPAMLQAIERARQRISFESFVFEDGAVARQFTDALVEAATRGVEVRLVLDAFGSLNISKGEVDRLTHSGVRVVWFNPLRPWTLEETNYRTHRKVLVADGRVAFTGGVGVADHWLGNARNEREWRDTQFEVHGPAVRTLEASFYENWLESGGEEVPALDLEQPPLATLARSVIIWSNASGGASNVKLLYLLSIAAARQRIDIQSPYFIVDGSTKWALDQARARGVRIRVLTDGDKTDARPVKFAGRAAYQPLLDAGYELYEYQPTMMHVKAMIVDGTWCLVGSANFDNRSFELNDELAVAVADADLARQLTEVFERDLTRSTRLTPEAWRSRPVHVKAREQLWSLFGELF